MSKCKICGKEGFHKLSCTSNTELKKYTVGVTKQIEEGLIPGEYEPMTSSMENIFTAFIPTLEGKEAEEFNRKADENYEKYKARQKQNLIDMMEADEKLGLYEKPQPTEDVRRLKSIEVKIDTLMYDLMTLIGRTESEDCAEPTDQQTTEKLYTIEDIERCVENWGLCKVEREYIEKFLETYQNKEDESK